MTLLLVDDDIGQLELLAVGQAYQIQEDIVLHGFGGQRGLLSFGGSS